MKPSDSSCYSGSLWRMTDLGETRNKGLLNATSAWPSDVCTVEHCVYETQRNAIPNKLCDHATPLHVFEIVLSVGTVDLQIVQRTMLTSKTASPQGQTRQNTAAALSQHEASFGHCQACRLLSSRRKKRLCCQHFGFHCGAYTTPATNRPNLQESFRQSHCPYKYETVQVPRAVDAGVHRRFKLSEDRAVMKTKGGSKRSQQQKL